MKLLGYRELYASGSASSGRRRTSTSRRTASTGTSASPPEERYQRMYGLSSFFIGEQRVAAELGPMMRAVPDEEMRLFLCTQIADEARHVAFFDRFYARGRRARGRQPRGAPRGDAASTSTRSSATLFDEMLQRARRPPGRRARGPRGAGRGRDDLPHGHRGDARPHRPALHHRLQRAAGHAARASSQGFTQRRARRAPPRRLRRALPARHGAHATRATARRSSARWSRSARRPTASSAEVDGRRRRRDDAVRRDGGRDARVRDEGARAAPEGHRAAAAS